MKTKNVGTILSIGAIIGFIAGFIAFLNHIIPHRYVQYRMYRLIALGFQRFLNKWMILTIIISFLVFIVWIIWELFFSNVIEIRIKDKNNFIIFLVSPVCFMSIIFAVRTVDKYWMYHRFHPISLLIYAGILLFIIFLSWILIKIKWKKLLVLLKGRSIKITAIILVSFLAIINLSIVVDRKINSPKGPNIVLIGVDTLRADHLKCYGYNRDTSPEIDRLAKEGVSFSECISHMPATTPSFASILTSKQPISHGVLDNNYKGYSLDNRHLTLAEILKNEGYKTGAFVSGWTLKKNANLTQGFDEYDDNFPSSRSGARRSAESVNKHVLQWIENHKNDKFFLFIHYFDPHGKYEPPPPYDSCFNFTKKVGDITRIPGYQRHHNISDPSFYIAQYDGEIKYTDCHVGQVLDKLKELDLSDEAFIVFTSDHGETMAEHLRWFDHGCFVYEEQIHVPLLLWYPKMFKHKKINTLVTHIDILPTILDVLKVGFAEGVEGRSLLPLLEADIEENKFIYCESARGNPKRNKDVIKGIGGKQFAIMSKEWKLIRTKKTSGIYYELYNLKDDAKELNNLTGQKLDMEIQLKSKLSEFVEEYKNSPYYIKKAGKILRKEKDKKEKIKALKSLGYL